MKEKTILQDVDATSDVTSVPLDLGDLTNYSISVLFSGGAGNLVGSLKLQAATRDDVAASYIDIPGTTQAVAASGDHQWNVSNAAYRYVRAVWTFTSGTGNIEMVAVIVENVIKGA